FSDYPKEAFQVRERFPPLRDRIHGNSRASLFAELGKEYFDQLANGIRGRLVYPEKRDEIIIHELLSRGPLSESEVQQAVVGPFDKGNYGDGVIINSRIGAFLAAVATRGQLSLYAPILERVLLVTPIQAAAEDLVVPQ